MSEDIQRFYIFYKDKDYNGMVSKVHNAHAFNSEALKCSELANGCVHHLQHSDDGKNEVFSTYPSAIRLLLVHPFSPHIAHQRPRRVRKSRLGQTYVENLRLTEAIGAYSTRSWNRRLRILPLMQLEGKKMKKQKY